MPTFTFDPDLRAAKKKQPAFREVKFGDGYIHRVKFGIKQNPQTWELGFTNRENSEIEDIEDFLEEREGYLSFEWTPPNEATARDFICRSWVVSTVNASYKSLSATFEEVFE